MHVSHKLVHDNTESHLLMVHKAVLQGMCDEIVGTEIETLKCLSLMFASPCQEVQQLSSETP